MAVWIHLPATVIIDRSGRVAATQVGLIGHDGLEGDIKAILNKPLLPLRTPSTPRIFPRWTGTIHRDQ